MTDGNPQGFTLIELSIVLVIIGLIVGGVLVGQNLIDAAAVRAQISQIEKYNAATNTFKSKYGFLPGDIPNPYASQFGFVTRGNTVGEGDGNGIIQGYSFSGAGHVQSGETGMFWVDLSTAGLIDGSFSAASPSSAPASDVTGSNLGLYFPAAKIGGGNFVYAWSLGSCNPGCTTYSSLGINYFGISIISLLSSGNFGKITSTTGISVQQAYSIDTKIDDGMPSTGNVLAAYVSGDPSWAGTGTDMLYSTLPASVGYAPGSCFDNTQPATTSMHYSTLHQNTVTNLNCALSFQMQGAAR